MNRDRRPRAGERVDPLPPNLTIGTRPETRRALAGIPSHPRSVALTWSRWRRMGAALERSQPAYGELSLASLRMWRGGRAIRVSRIGAFLVIRFADGSGESTIVALPGARLPAPIRRALAAFLAEHPVRFVSVPTKAALSPVLPAAGVQLEPQRDDADYVYALPALAAMPGGRGRDARRFARRHEPVLRTGRLGEPWAQEHLAATFDRWLEAKHGGVEGAPEGVRVERAGVVDWQSDAAAADLRVFAVSVDGAPVAVSVVDELWSRTWMGVMFKADPRLDGAVAWLRQEVARAGVRELGPRGVLNIQQDDGVTGIREAKTSFRPLRLEPKFASVPVRAEPGGGDGRA